MKRTIFTLLFSLIAILPAFSFSYEEARQQAWYLTDKMAYELNLSPEQYDRAYQTNLDYFMSLRSSADCYGYAWSYREADLRCILFDWQFSLYEAADYFVRPVRWLRSAWYWPIFERYAVDYYYYNRPSVYLTYRGGMWAKRVVGGPSPYASFRPRYGEGMRNHYSAWRPDFGGRNVRPAQPGPGTWRPDFGERDNRPSTGYNNPPRPNNGNGHSQGTVGGSRPGYNNSGRPSTGTRPSTGHGQGNTSTTRPSTGQDGQTTSPTAPTARPVFNRSDRGNQAGGFNRTSGTTSTQQTQTSTAPSRGNGNSGTVNRGHGTFTPSQNRGSSTGTATPSRSTRSTSAPARTTNGGRTFGR